MRVYRTRVCVCVYVWKGVKHIIPKEETMYNGETITKVWVNIVISFFFFHFLFKFQWAEISSLFHWQKRERL